MLANERSNQALTITDPDDGATEAVALSVQRFFEQCEIILDEYGADGCPMSPFPSVFRVKNCGKSVRGRGVLWALQKVQNFKKTGALLEKI